MSNITIEEAQIRLPELIDGLTVDQEIVITRDGKPVGRLVPPKLSKGVPMIGRGKGKLIEMIDDDDHLKDFAEYME